jgi:hypothetical protein
MWIIVGLCGLALTGGAECATSGAGAQTERVVTFALDERPGKAGGAGGRRVTIAVFLTGLPVDKEEIVAVVEGTLLTRRMVPMAPGARPNSWETSFSLDLAVPPKGQAMMQPTPIGDPAQYFHRVDVSFARLKGMGFAPLLKRSVYLGLEPRPARKEDDPPEDPPPAVIPEASPPPVLPVMAEPKPMPGIERPSVDPVLDGVVIETDIALPVPKPKATGPDYWEELQHRVTARFGERLGPRASVARPPRVQFRLYWDGVAQIIFLERSSGSAQVDQAGLDSVVDAHPFPPFPRTVAGPYADVHVDFSDRPASSATRHHKKR